MQKVLKKRIFRDFKQNIARYLALSFLIILSMYLVVSIIAAAETIINGTKDADKAQSVEDGQFSLFLPMTDSEWDSLIDEGITLEKMFFLDYSVDDGKTIRVYKNRQDIDKVAICKGEPAANDDELVLERKYAEKNDINVGDSITLGGHTYKISGIGTVPDYDSPLKAIADTGCDSKNFGIVFVTENTYDMLRDEGKSVKSEEYYYAYQLNDKMTDDELKDCLKELSFSASDVDDEYFQEYWDRTLGREDEIRDGIDELVDGAEELKNGLSELTSYNDMLGNLGNPALDSYLDGTKDAYDGSVKVYDGLSEFKDETDDMLDEIFNSDAGNLLTFLTAEDNVRIQAAADDQELNRSVGMIAGVIILILIAYVLSVFVVHSIDQESQVIGALYALGVKRRDLMRHYVFLPTIIAFVSGTIGTLIAYTDAGVRYQMQDCYNYYSLPELDVAVMPYLFVYGIIVPPIVCLVVTSLVIRKRLSKPVLTLLKNEQKAGKGKDIKLKNMKFMKLFKIRQIIRERRTAFTVIFGMFVSILLLVMSLEIYVYCNQVEVEYVEDTKFEYMYTYKYPAEKAPEGGYKAYAKDLKKDIYGFDFDVTLLGIEDDNPFFDVKTSDSKDKVTISSSIAYKYNLGVGDIITLKDEENDSLYAFYIEAVTQYAPNFMVFMSYDKALELFGEQDDYYNVVFADHDLNIESGRLYSTTTREDVKKSAGIFSEQMRPMIIMIGGVSIVIFVIVLYLMMKVMIDRSSFSIALVKIFGYRNKELKRMYLDGNFYVILIGAVISIPLAKVILDAIYGPAFVPNVACGVDKSFSIWIYGAMFIGTIILYLIINQLLVRRIKKMLPAEVLKNRE